MVIKTYDRIPISQAMLMLGYLANSCNIFLDFPIISALLQLYVVLAVREKFKIDRPYRNSTGIPDMFKAPEDNDHVIS